jgi:hypothetical protein
MQKPANQHTPPDTLELNINSASHNPIIADLPRDSFNNIYAVLATIKTTITFSEIEGYGLEGDSAHGMYLIMNCVMDALRFEIEHRRGD